MLDYPRFYPDQVVPPERFGDRTDQLRQIEYTLQAIQESRPRGAMICGERGIGKTSLLHKAEAMCMERKMLPLHIALHDFPDVREFYDTIFEEVGSALKNIGMWEKLRVALGEFEKGWDYVVRLQKRPRTLQAEVHERLSLLLEKMTRRGHRSLVFFLDESDGLKAHVVARAEHISGTQKRILASMDFLGATTPKKIAQRSGAAQATIPTQLQRMIHGKIVRKAGRGEYEIVDRDLAEHVRISLGSKPT